MERDKAIKIGIAGVIGLVAIIILAMNFLGGSSAPKPAEDAPPPKAADERGGGGRLAPGADGG